MTVVLLCAACGNDDSQEPIVATIGESPITAEAFRISYELAPASARPTTGTVDQRKRQYLLSMIEDYLLARAAERQGFDSHEDFRRILAWHEQQAVIRQLYRDVVRDHVKISEDELRDAFVLFNRRLFLRQLRYSSAEMASAAYESYRNGSAFEDLAREVAANDAELQRMQQAREFTWGELDEAMETAAHGLSANEISAPIRTRLGFHLVQLVDRKESLIVTESAFNANRSLLEGVIRRRREGVLARDYLMQLASGQEPKVDTSVLMELSSLARNTMLSSSESPVPAYLQPRTVRPAAEAISAKLLLVFNDGGGWTVGEFLDRVQALPPATRPDLTVPAALMASVATITRDAYLADEGYRRGLGAGPYVEQELARVRDDLLSALMRSTVEDSVAVDDIELRQYYSENRSRYVSPERLRVQEVLVKRRSEADSILAAVAAGADLGKIAGERTMRSWARKRNGDLGFFSSGAFGAVGQLAAGMQVGDLGGPAEVKFDEQTTGYSVVRLLDRVQSSEPELDTILDSVRRDAVAAHRVEAFASIVAAMEQDYPVTIFEKELREVHTSDESIDGRPMDMVIVNRP